MKMPRKLIISALVCLTGATLATSVTSTVAWFQYATKVTAAYTGTTAHCSKLLQVSVDQGAHWKSDLLDADLPDASFVPVTTGAQTKNTALSTYVVSEQTKTRFYTAPNYRQGLYSNWLIAKDNNYSQFTLWVKATDVDENYGTGSETRLVNDVYLTDLTIQNAGTIDLAKAIRVHFDAESPDGTHKYFLFAKEATTTSVGGYLDIDNNGEYDPAGYEWESGFCMYGGEGLTQTSYTATDSSVVATDTKGVLSNGTSFGSTSANSDEYLKITVTIWLEGWALLSKGAAGNKDSAASSTAVWDSATYASKNFNVGMTFGVQLHADDE